MLTCFNADALINPPVYFLLLALVLVLAAISVNGTADRPNPLLRDDRMIQRHYGVALPVSLL